MKTEVVMANLDYQPDIKDHWDISESSNLTRSQFLMWLGQKMNPGIPLYNMIQTFDIQGQVSPYIFEQAFSRLVEESEVLRTVIWEENSIPQRHILSRISQPVEFLDFSNRPDPFSYYLSWLDDRRARPFNLEERLFESILIKLSAERFVWYLSQHHLITDGWSFLLVYQRTAAWYAALQQEEPVDPPGLPSYTDYINIEQEHRSSKAFSQAEAYWNDRQKVPPDPVSFYGQAVTQRTSRTERVVCDLGPDRSARLQQMIQKVEFRSFSQDFSLFNVFTTVFSAFLHRLNGVQQVAVGVPLHNRPTPAFKETIGLFIEICPLRVEVSEEDTFVSLYKKVAIESFNALRYTQPGISSAERNRAYEVLLNFVNVSFPSFCGFPVQVDWVHPGYGDSNHSLRLQIHDFNATGSYALHFDFNCGIFTVDQRQQVIDQFLRVFDGFLADPGQPINHVRLASPLEEQAYIVDFNRSEAPYPANQTVVSLFETQVELTPGEDAVVFGAECLTYRELNRRANQLAHHLRRLGAGPEKLVGICMEHSLEMVVGLLGILKSGAAYVPLDPAYPRERLAFMLEDICRGTGVTEPLLVTQPWLLDRLPERSMRRVLLDNTWSTVAEESEENPQEKATSQNLAYVIFTSGSTGRPKGAMIEHRGLVNYLWWAKQAYLKGEKLDFALFSSLSFDLTVTSIYLPLISGSRTVVYREDPGVRGMVILKVIQDNQVDLIKLTPAHLSLIRDMNLGATRVRKLIVGGEDFKTVLARAISNAFNGKVEIYNEYGPTETVVGCMIHRFDPEKDDKLSVPIGVPAANAQIYVLDKFFNQVPTGVIGEMYVGGDGVGRGYLNRPELTRQKFLSNPFRAGERMYRTGDLARWEADGKLTFLGRADNQVKVGGARIELGEVEARLREHPAIRDCIVDVVQLERQAEPVEMEYCIRCGLASNFPGIQFDEQGLCSECRAYDRYKDRAGQYFKSMDDLDRLFRDLKADRAREYHCLVLLSGGKDSTYMLYRLAGMGLKILAFTLDNGYISEQAKSNIRRVVASLNIDHIFGATPAMNAIFVDSLRQYSNVCNGCFKTLYTLAVQVARQKGIPYIVTGLSRGQFFETRLTEDLFRNPDLDVETIDRAILEARKAYHRREDIISRSLDVDAFREDSVFENIQFVDFYRYCDVELDEMYTFLQEHAPWVRPDDTGRSTNCLINDVGIYIHNKQRGFHNYALPYSWDVRLGHKSRSAALAELQDEIDENRVKQILAEIGYPEAQVENKQPANQLVAYYVADHPIPAAELRQHLMQGLPDYMVPAFFIHLDHIPLTPNGKVDRRALPRPEKGRPQLEAQFIPPSSPIEQQVAEIWCQVLGLDRIGIHDNFFELGGVSLPALQVISRVIQKFQVTLPVQRFFENPTVAKLSLLIVELLLAEIEEMSEEDAVQHLGRPG